MNEGATLPAGYHRRQPSQRRSRRQVAFFPLESLILSQAAKNSICLLAPIGAKIKQTEFIYLVRI